MSQAQFGVAITADDKTAKGIASAEKRIGKLTGRAGQVNAAQARAAQDSVTRSGRGILGTFSRVEQAGARLFGGRSMTSGVTSRLGAMGEAAGSLRVGMTEASAAGGVLEGTIGAVGVAAGATIGILAAAGYAAFKLADGWAKGAATIGRTAETIGVGTKALQEFTAAAERQGMDKGAASGTLGNISQTLNDARYGRNNAALAILSRLGVKMQLNSDGTVNVAAMLPAIADAIARQNSSGRRTAAGGLGIGLDALPVFAQGGKALSGDMADADAHAAVIDDAGIASGRRIARKGVMVGQLADRGMASAGAATAGVAERGYDAVLGAGKAIADGTASFGGVVSRTFAPAADKIAQGGRAIERAAVGLTSAAIETAGVRLSHNARVHRNPGNVRPVNGSGFVTYPTYGAGIAAMASQIRRDQTHHGAQTVTDVIAGAVGKDGKRHWGYAPPEDHNDTSAYIRNVSRTMGVSPTARINLSDPETLARETYAHIKQENGHEVFTLDQVRAVVSSMHIENHITVEDRRVVPVRHTLPGAPDQQSATPCCREN